MFLTQEKMWQRQAFYWLQLKSLTLAKFLKSCDNVEDEGLLQDKEDLYSEDYIFRFPVKKPEV